jgi:hypothetical protein
MMMGQAVEVDWNDMTEAVPAFLTLFSMLVTFSISNGVLLGLVSAALLRLSSGQAFEDCFPTSSSSATTAVMSSELELLRNSGGDGGTHRSYNSSESPGMVAKGDYSSAV